MARADTPTLLALDSFAAVTGINPSHFNGSDNSNVMPLANNPCNDLWPQYSWQAGDRVSRDELAQEIAAAEQDIADYLNYWPAPKWIAQENHPYPRHYRPDVIASGGYDVRSYHKSVNTKYGYVIAPGQRAISAVSTGVAVVLSDADGDGYNETATVSVATTLTNACEVKVYFAGHSAAQEWEIRPARTKAISGGTFTATFWTWQLIDPDLWDALTTPDGFKSIDWTVAGNIVATVDVYREYNDTTDTSATFFWEPKTSPINWNATLSCGCGGSGCEACTLTTQDGCIHIRDAVNGIVVPAPATYDADEGEWAGACWSECREPDFVNVYYYAGQYQDRYLRGEVCEPLSRWWQETIAWLTIARLERTLCNCTNVVALSRRLQQDLTLIGEDESYVTSDDILDNPFGTRRGEVMAWKRLSKLAKKRMMAAVI